MIAKLEIVITDAFDSFLSYPHHLTGLFVHLCPKKWIHKDFTSISLFITSLLFILLINKHQENIHVLICFKKELQV
jgi:hypothetical protein